MHAVYHRELHGSGTFVTSLPDGTEVPWKPLSIGDFIEYDYLIKSNQYPYVYIEDETYRKCVLNQALVQNLNNLSAGQVSVVVQGILVYSGPQSIDELTEYLTINRVKSNEILHMLVTYVCQAFPAYKPEDVYNMDYPTFILRVAQAENKLLRTSAVSEPLSFVVPGQEKVEEPKKPNTQDLLEKYYEQEKVKPKEKPITKSQPKKDKNFVVTKQEMNEHVIAYTGHEKEDKAILEHQMIKETSSIYKDYLEQSKDGKIILKTPEERKAEYLAKIEKNKQEYILMQKKQKEQQEKLAKQQAEKDIKKAKRLPNKRRK